MKNEEFENEIEETEEVEETEEIEETEEVEETEEIDANPKEAADFLDEKGKKSVFKTIFNVVFWLVIGVLLIVWVMDYLNVRNDKKPNFCLSNTTHEFEDGTVDECVGLGYKIYTYKRSSMETGTEFVPFFVGMKKSSK